MSSSHKENKQLVTPFKKLYQQHLLTFHVSLLDFAVGRLTQLYIQISYILVSEALVDHSHMIDKLR